MAKIKIESDFGFAFEVEENGFNAKVNRASALDKALEALTLEADKYIPDEIGSRPE